MFGAGEVCILKHHPLLAAVGPAMEKALAAFVECGALRFVYGGAEEGRYLTDHNLVDSIHITGSAAVHDRIVWGDDAESIAKAKAAASPRLDKVVTSELGCVTRSSSFPASGRRRRLSFRRKVSRRWWPTTLPATATPPKCSSPRDLATTQGLPCRAAERSRCPANPHGVLSGERREVRTLHRPPPRRHTNLGPTPRDGCRGR